MNARKTPKFDHTSRTSRAKLRSPARPPKKQITLRLDTDVIAWFKRHAAKGAGYQTEMNRVLRQHMHRRARALKEN